MDVGRQQIARRLVDEPLAVDPAAPGKERADERHPEMGLAGGTGPGMTRVARRLVLDLQMLRAELRLQPPPQLVLHPHPSLLGSTLSPEHSGTRRRRRGRLSGNCLWLCGLNYFASDRG